MAPDPFLTLEKLVGFFGRGNRLAAERPVEVARGVQTACSCLEDGDRCPAGNPGGLRRSCERYYVVVLLHIPESTPGGSPFSFLYKPCKVAGGDDCIIIMHKVCIVCIGI